MFKLKEGNVFTKIITHNHNGNEVHESPAVINSDVIDGVLKHDFEEDDILALYVVGAPGYYRIVASLEEVLEQLGNDYNLVEAFNTYENPEHTKMGLDDPEIVRSNGFVLRNRIGSIVDVGKEGFRIVTKSGEAFLIDRSKVDEANLWNEKLGE